MPRPDLSRVPEYYHDYINQAEGDDLVKTLIRQTEEMIKFLKKIPKKKRNYRYAEGKWSIREVLQHIIDAERIFAYRALCFARKDNTPLPSFDETIYAVNSKADIRKWKDLFDDFLAARRATEKLFESFDEEQMEANGIASGKPNYVSGIGFTIVGHANHHMKVIKERYLVKEKNEQ